jgi:hypothetical protein
MSSQIAETAEEKAAMDLQRYEQEGRAIIKSIMEAPDGECKNAATASENLIRRRIRENGFLRRIIPPVKKTDADLDSFLDSELPGIIEEMEMDQPGAKTMSFADTPDTEFYRGDKFLVVFQKISSPEFTKLTDELRTYKNDFRKIVEDNAMKDIQTEEDFTAVATFDEIVGSASGVGLAGVKQHHEIAGDITRDTYVQTLDPLQDRQLNNAMYLLNRKSGNRFLTFDYKDIGGISEATFKDGLEGLSEGKVYGIRHLFTIKNDIVPDGYVYKFAEPDFLGRFYILEDLTAYVEKKKDVLRFSMHEKIGVTIPNVAAVDLTVFTGVN